MKRIICCFFAIMLMVSISSMAFAANTGLNNFQKVNEYSDGKFSDVSVGAWYANDVNAVYSFGLMKGNSDSTFNPDGNVTIAETLAMACRLHSIYYSGTADFTQGMPWYQVYVDYALENGIVTKEQFTDYTLAATRAEFVTVLAAALPSTALPVINTIEDDAIPDVPIQSNRATEIYMMYRAGILTGNDSQGTFAPDTNISRCAVAAIVNRLADKSCRKSIRLVSCYVGYPIQTIQGVVGATCTGSFTKWSDLLPCVEYYIPSCERYEYMFSGGVRLGNLPTYYTDEYDQYFTPYIEYLNSNPNLTNIRKPAIPFGGFNEESYVYSIEGSTKYLCVSWNNSSYTHRSWISLSIQ